VEAGLELGTVVGLDDQRAKGQASERLRPGSAYPAPILSTKYDVRSAKGGPFAGVPAPPKATTGGALVGATHP